MPTVKPAPVPADECAVAEVASPSPGDEARLRDEVTRLKRELDALQETTVSLTDEASLDGALGAIVRRAVALFDGTDGYLYLADDDGAMRLRVATGRLRQWVGRTVEEGDGVVGRVMASGEALAVNDYARWPGRGRDTGELALRAVAAAPLRAGADVMGIIGLCHLEGPGAFSPDDLAVLDRFGGLAAVALEHVRLHRDLHAELAERKQAEEELLDAVARLTGSEHALRLSHEEMVRRLAVAAEFRDVQTGRHVERVGGTCELIARALGLDESFSESIRVASPLHDIGKIGIPDHVLLKPGPLTAEERALIEGHAEIGHRILTGAGSELLDLAASIALTHHERYDGSGYPRGLFGAEIPIEGRIAAVADVFDALTSDRVYRPAYSVESALEMMREGGGSQFDPDVLDAFLAIRDELPGVDPGSPAPGASSAPAVSAPEHDARGVVVGILREAATAAVSELGRTADPRQDVEAAVRRLCEAAGAGVIASVYVLDHGRLWCLAQHGYDQVRDGFLLGQGVMGRCLDELEAQYVPDVHADPSFIGAVPGIVSELAIPLVGERTRAVLNVETIGVSLPPASHEAFEALAPVLARTIDATNRPFQLDLSGMARLCVHASSLRGVPALAEFAARTLGRLFDLEASQVDLGAVPSGPPAAFWRRPASVLVPIPAARIAEAAETGLSDAAVSVVETADLGLDTAHDEAHWLLWLPLRAGGILIGTLVGRASQRIELEPEQSEAATLLAQHTAALIDVAQALRREQRAAVTDGLTGLLNRRGFDERLREELARADRGDGRLAIVLTDCDDLKRINDTHGHDRGDAVLQTMARLIRESKRASDVAGRLGGDEFGIVLPGAGVEVAMDVAERLRTRMRAASHDGSCATASFGIAVYPDDGRSSVALLRSADRALYDAKNGGKDRLATVG